MAMDLHYFHGDCSTPEAQAQIKRNFIEILNNSLRYSEICRYPVVKDKCKAENVKVTCSMVNNTIKRKKRSLGELQTEYVVKIILLLWKTKPGLYQGILGDTREYIQYMDMSRDVHPYDKFKSETAYTWHALFACAYDCVISVNTGDATRKI